MVRVLFMGRKSVAAETLEYIQATNRAKIVGVLTDSHLPVSPTTVVAQKLNLPLYDFPNALEEMRTGKLYFDMGVSVLYWRKIRDEFLSIPKRGIINFHPAPLPDYKGTAGYNMAILDCLEKWAASAHYMDKDIDTGGIIDISSFNISHDQETAQSLERKTMPILFNLIKKTIDKALSCDGLLPFSANQGGRYISRSEMEKMKEIKDGDDVSRKIRAFWFPPYDGAYKVVNGVKCTLIDNYILQQLADPGTSNLFMSSENNKQVKIISS